MKGRGGDIAWNLSKFLVTDSGKTVKQYAHDVPVDVIERDLNAAFSAGEHEHHDAVELALIRAEEAAEEAAAFAHDEM
jgi:hypothetical protein